MAGHNKSSGGNILGAIGIIAGTLASLSPVIETVVDKIADDAYKKADKKELVIIPALYEKGFPLDLSQVSELLANYGLKVIPSKLSIQEADVKYKDCFDSQVIDSEPKHKQKVVGGSTVIVKYISQDVINECQRLFDEMETQKAETKRIRSEKRAQRKEQSQKVIFDATGKMTSSISKILTHPGQPEKGDTTKVD